MIKIKGYIEDSMPTFSVNVDKGTGILKIENPGWGLYRFVIDTGFTGGVSVPDEVFDSLNLDLAGFEMFKLASGEIVELPVYLGSVEVFSKKMKAWFIPGEPLLGMEFLSAVGDTLVLDFEASTVELISK